MRISDLNDEERKAFEEHLLSTYRYDAATGKLINKKWNREYPGVIYKNGYVYVNVFFHKLGRSFILEAQKLPIYEVSAQYSGPVCLIHGDKDKIVPVRYSEQFHQAYKTSELHILKGEGHLMNGDKARLVETITTFLKSNL